MARYKDYNTGQTRMEMINIEEELPDDNRARIIKEIVSSLDVSSFDKNYHNDEKGANANDVRMMLGIIYLASLRGIRGSRSIAQVLDRDLEFKYILQGHKAPDDSTIRKFRSRHADEFPGVFAMIVHLASALGMIDFGALAIDGTKIKAYASLYETKNRRGLKRSIALLERRMRKILKRIEDENNPKTKEQLEKRKKSVEKRQEVVSEFESLLEDYPEDEKVNRVDPDARLMKTADGKSIIGYNAQAAVDTGEHGIIVAAELSQNATDESLLLDMADKAEKNSDNEFDTILGDAGYVTYESMENAERDGKKILGPDRQYDTERYGKGKKGEFSKSHFKYDEIDDLYTCPAGHSLELQRMTETKASPLMYEYFNRVACVTCCNASLCCSKGQRHRVISRDYREMLKENIRKELDSNDGYLLYGRRSQTVETSFGNVKQNKGVRQLFYRGHKFADAEWKHICTGINLSKIVKFLQGKDWAQLLHGAF